MRKIFKWGLIIIIDFLILAFLAKAYGKEITKEYKLPTKIVEIESTGHGRWFMAEDGHAVYCYGPIVRIGGFLGNLEYYATNCIGKNKTVKLHD